MIIKRLLLKCVTFYHDFWKEQFTTMNYPQMQKVMIQNEIIKFKEEVTNSNVKEFDRHAKVHKIDKTNASVNEMID